MLRDFDSLHAGTETHGSIGLGKTTNHTASDTGDEGSGASVTGVELGF